MGLVLSSKVGVDEAARALSELASGVDLALVQTFDTVRMVPAGELVIEGWDSVRCFGINTEVRLRRSGSMWAMLILTDSASIVEGWAGQRAEAHRYGAPERWRLWGERIGKVFRDDRIPAPLSYPMATGGLAALEVVRYRIGDEPLPSLVRYLRLVDETGG